MSEFKRGDVVQLKSGGPAMTIEEIGDYTHGADYLSAYCVWFENKKREGAPFALHMLKLADADGAKW